MKWLATVCVVVLLFAVVASWVGEPESDIDAPWSTATESDASHNLEDVGEPRKERGRQQGGNPFVKSEARIDGSTASATPSSMSTSLPLVSTGTITAKAESVVSDNAIESTEVQGKEASSAEPSDSHNDACEAVAKTLREARSIFDLTPTQAVWYSRGRLSETPHPNSGFILLKQTLLAQLCSGTSAFDAAYEIKSEFVAVSTESHARILVGDHWISDGSILSPLSPAEYAILTGGFVLGRRSSPGPNMTREKFDRLLAENPMQLIVN